MGKTALVRRVVRAKTAFGFSKTSQPGCFGPLRLVRALLWKRHDTAGSDGNTEVPAKEELL